MRSIRSWIAERLLKRFSNKDSFTNEKSYAKFLKEKQIENEKPYVLPKYIQRKFGMVKQHFDGMECYIFNEEKRLRENPSSICMAEGILNNHRYIIGIFFGS